MDPQEQMYHLIIQQRGVRQQIRKPTTRELKSRRRRKRYHQLQKYWKQRLEEIEIELRTVYLNEVLGSIQPELINLCRFLILIVY